MSEFEIRQVPLQHTAVVHVTTPVAGIGPAMGEALPKAFAAVGATGAVPSGPAICKYTAYSEDSVTFETGVTVASLFAAEGDVVAGQIGGCEAGVTTHVGPYESIGETYGKLQGWLESQGKKPATVMWEAYLDDPQTTDPSKLRTEVFWPFE